MTATRLPDALGSLTGVGPEVVRKLAVLGIETPANLLEHIPRDYRDWRNPPPVASLAEGEGIALGRIAAVRERQGRYPLVTADIDGEGDGARLTAKWFGRRHLFGRLHAGERIFVSGRVVRTGSRPPEMNVVSHRILGDDEAYVGEVVPIYPATKELPSRTIRTLIGKNLNRLIADRPERLPAGVRERHALLGSEAAWRAVHQPDAPERAAEARRRIFFEEFLAIALAAALKRRRRAATGGAPVLRAGADLLPRFTAALPFALTGAQRRVIGEIWHDMGETTPMNRLLQGDVGSGKTLVAAAAIVLAAQSGYQSALMAPTEILAAQHAQKLAPLLLPFGIAVEALFGSMGAAARRGANDRVRSGEALLAVGTHALLTESVEFARLGLTIVDEQHRFGVAQRAQLRAKSESPHALAMTATPIPRTLAQTRYADLDVSVIDELPAGRTPIETYVVRASRKAHVYEFVRANVELGRQAYVVTPSIEADPSAEVPAAPLTRAVEEYDSLRTGVFADVQVGLVHGRMPAREKDAAMAQFTRGDTDVLVATTVVEVGVDVPNASVMVVLDAHRYGLAQLHQLRGRVGRGIERSFCILVAPDDAAEVERLEILASTNDGFEIAEADLRIRREGEFAGTAQAGAASGTIGDIVQDFALYMHAKTEADRIVAADPELREREHASLEALVSAQATARAILITS